MENQDQNQEKKGLCDRRHCVIFLTDFISRGSCPALGHSRRWLERCDSSRPILAQQQWWKCHFRKCGICMEVVLFNHVDGRNPPVEVGSLSHYLQGFIYSMPGGAGFLPSTVDSSIVRKCCVPTFSNVSRNQIWNQTLLDVHWDTLVIHDADTWYYITTSIWRLCSYNFIHKWSPQYMF